MQHVLDEDVAINAIQKTYSVWNNNYKSLSSLVVPRDLRWFGACSDYQ